VASQPQGSRRQSRSASKSGTPPSSTWPIACASRAFAYTPLTFRPADQTYAAYLGNAVWPSQATVPARGQAQWLSDPISTCSSLCDEQGNRSTPPHQPAIRAWAMRFAGRLRLFQAEDWGSPRRTWRKAGRSQSQTTNQATCAASLCGSDFGNRWVCRPTFRRPGGSLPWATTAKIFERQRGPCLCAETGSCENRQWTDRWLIYSRRSADHTGCLSPDERTEAPIPGGRGSAA